MSIKWKIPISFDTNFPAGFFIYASHRFHSPTGILTYLVNFQFNLGRRGWSRSPLLKLNYMYMSFLLSYDHIIAIYMCAYLIKLLLSSFSAFQGPCDFVNACNRQSDMHSCSCGFVTYTYKQGI